MNPLLPHGLVVVTFTCESCRREFQPRYRSPSKPAPRFCSLKCFGSSLRAAVADRTSKRCSVCKVEKPLDNFWREARRADGHAAVCKECRLAHRRGAGRLAEARYVRSEAGIASSRGSLARLRSDPAKYAAHKAVQVAIASGKLAPQACEVCGSGARIHAHHDDYSRPLDVRWLCPLHHARHHAQLRKAS